MAKNIASLCEEKLKSTINQLGYELLEVEYAKKSNGMNLSFYIDSTKGIFIEDCEKVHRAIDDVLEELNPTDDKPYILNVCSPGLDRPIKNEYDARRNMGQKVEVKTYSTINKQKHFIGELVGYGENEVVLNIEGENIAIEKSAIANIVPYIEL